VFFALADVRDKLERWRQDYNLVRPHSALRDHAPAWFAAQWQNTAARAPATAAERRKNLSLNVLLESLN
jgi:transposase InsO family protein